MSVNANARSECQITYLFEVLLFLYSRNNIVESVFIAFGCRLDFLDRSFKRLPFDAWCKHIILAKNVVALLTQKNKLLLNIWNKNRMPFQNHLSTIITLKKYIFQSLKPSFIQKIIKYYDNNFGFWIRDGFTLVLVLNYVKVMKGTYDVLPFFSVFKSLLSLVKLSININESLPFLSLLLLSNRSSASLLMMLITASG